MVGKNLLEHPKSKEYNFIAPSRKDLDLLDPHAVGAFISKESPKFVIHAAGHVGGIQANMKNPQDYLLKNLNMSLNVIVAADNYDVKNFLNLGSSCMYPRHGFNPLKEETILSGELEPTNEGYALAKIVASRLCDYISSDDSTKMFKTIIPCNLFGRYDKYDPKHSHMIPAVIRRLHYAKLRNKETVEVWGDGSARREFMSAGDLADFIFYAIENFVRMPQVLNVGIGRDFTIKQYYEAIASVVGYKGIFKYDISKPIGMKQKLVDNSRQKEFGWVNTQSLEEGIVEAYNFFINKEHL